MNAPSFKHNDFILYLKLIYMIQKIYYMKNGEFRLPIITTEG